MRKRALYAAALVTMLAASCTLVQAQAPALPQTYSFVAASEMAGPMTITVHRNGSKEVVEWKMNSGNGHMRQLYDFERHRVFNLDLQVNRCTTQEYTSAYAPMTQDPIGSSAEMIDKIVALPAVGKENVNGIAAKVVEATIAEARGKYKYWLDEKTNIPVKMAIAMEGQPQRVLFELRQLSFAPSAANLFLPPPGCGPVSGSVSATGGHAEASAEVSVSATHQFGEPAAPGKVTGVTLRVEPPNYSGPCPANLKLIGEITTDGPGTVWYEFLAGAVRIRNRGPATVKFTAAGTQTVTVDAEYVMTPRTGTSLIAVMADADGKRGIQNLSSGSIPFNATCTAGRK